MISTSYEGKDYSYTDAGWVDDSKAVVSLIMQNFLSRKAISEGAESSIFPHTKKVAISISKPKKKEESPRKGKYDLRAGIKLF